MFDGMDVNQILFLVMVLISCLALIIRALRSRLVDRRAEVLTAVIVLGITAIGYGLRRDQAGTIGLVAWAGLLLAPSLAVRLLMRAVIQQEYTRARKLALLLRWLQPFSNWRDYIELMRASELLKQGNTAAAEAILAKPHQLESAFGRVFLLQLQRMKQDWPALLASTTAQMAQPTFGQHSSDLTILSFHLRALGETGDLNGLVAAYSAQQTLITKAPWLLDYGRLYIYAFCGRLPALALLLRQPSLTSWPPAILTYWRGVAHCAAGQWAEGSALFTTIAENEDPLVRATAARWLACLETGQQHPTTLPPEADQILTAQAQQQIAHIEREHQRALEAGLQAMPSNRRPLVTYTLIAINVAIFGWELWLGATDHLERLYQLGALMPAAVLLGGQWWRLVSSTFLHFSIMHLAFNMLGLWYLGRLVEARLGAWRYLLLYLLSGILPMALYPLLLWLGKVSPVVLVAGASGSIMGVLGAEAAILLRLWRVDQSQVARQRFFLAALIVAMQASLDLLIPHFSFSGHLSGALIGFVLALLLYRVPRESQTPTLATVQQG
ncbi:MAG: rhomboid family intramembrane serine protease [Caldilineaceae bacterium]